MHIGQLGSILGILLWRASLGGSVLFEHLYIDIHQNAGCNLVNLPEGCPNWIHTRVIWSWWRHKSSSDRLISRFEQKESFWRCPDPYASQTSLHPWLPELDGSLCNVGLKTISNSFPPPLRSNRMNELVYLLNMIRYRARRILKSARLRTRESCSRT